MVPTSPDIAAPEDWAARFRVPPHPVGSGGGR